MITNNPKAVFFDWDGTLVNTLTGLRKSHNHVRTSFGFPEWTEEQFHENMKHSARELYPSIYGDRTEEALKTLYDFYATHHLDGFEVLPGALDLLKFLKDAGIVVGIVSNKRHEYLLREVSHVGWEGYTAAIVGAGVAKRDKPAGDPIIHALSLAGLKPHPEDVWFVGDTETDLLAAKDAGCASVLLLHGKQKDELAKKHKPSLIKNDCFDFQSVFKAPLRQRA